MSINVRDRGSPYYLISALSKMELPQRRFLALQNASLFEKLIGKSHCLQNKTYQEQSRDYSESCEIKMAYAGESDKTSSILMYIKLIRETNCFKAQTVLNPCRIRR